MGLLLVGYGFKVALVPFHQWTPDVYQGAPTSVTAFMSVATKTAAFASLIRVLASLTSHDRPWLIVLAALAVLTMTLGNLAALRQTSLKRMLAYSSIAHAGYVLVGLAAGTSQGAQAALYYLLAYTFMNLGAFAVVLAVQRRDENDVTLERITGLSSRQPGMAILMAIFMFALTGIPPLAGFFGKLYVLRRGGAGEPDLAGHYRGAEQRDCRVLLPAGDCDHVHGRSLAGQNQGAQAGLAGLDHGYRRHRCDADPGPLAVPLDSGHPAGRKLAGHAGIALTVSVYRPIVGAQHAALR